MVRIVTGRLQKFNILVLCKFGGMVLQGSTGVLEYNLFQHCFFAATNSTTLARIIPLLIQPCFTLGGPAVPLSGVFFFFFVSCRDEI